VSDVHWQTFLPDEGLQRIVARALVHNRDLRLAALNVEMARARYGIQRGELFPNLYGTGSGGRERASADLTAPGQPRTTEWYSLGLGVLSWEIDFFGRVRNLKDQALETYLAGEEARRSANILLVATVADAYMTLAAEREALALAESTLQAQTETYDLVRRQYELGIVTELDLQRARIPVAAARADLARSTRQVAQARHALEFLVGGGVAEDLLPNRLGEVHPPAAIAAGQSSDVLLARPDVIAAEHQLKGAHAFIGAARAAFFPRITLTGTLGTASDQLSGLFGADTGTWSYTPQLSVPIFDARVWSGYRVSRVQRELAVAQYEKAIQAAFREVADALARCGTVQEQLAAQEELVDALAETHRLALARFEQGVDGYLSVLDAQRSLFAAEQALVYLRLAHMTSRVSLYAALGGGWQPEPLAGTVSAP
jgi:multidrug efflux system outer membrane protein